MDLETSMQISASAMRAQGTRMRIIAENIANADTARNTPDEQPYQRQVVTFEDELNRETGAPEVSVSGVLKDQSAYRMKHMPGHPGADANGYVAFPNVDIVVETMDMREAQRSYEANLNMIEMSRTMAMRTIDLLRE